MYSGFFLLSIIIQLAHLTPPKAFGAVGACTDSYRQIPSGPTKTRMQKCIAGFFFTVYNYSVSPSDSPESLRGGRCLHR
jgi:hypothetical protein